MAARSPPLPLKVLRLADRAAGLLAHGGTGLVQLALIFLGTHLAADHLDDLILAVLEGGVDGLEHALAGPAMTMAAALELAPGRLMLWRGLPLGAAAAWTALAVELVVVWRLWSNLALVPFAATGTLEGWRKAQSVRAVVVPITLLGVLVAGAWSLAMATEDLLPASPVAGIAAALVGLAVFARHGMGALHRTIAGLDPNPPVRTGVLEALVLLPITCLVWTQCVPWWGLFELVGGLRQGAP